MKSQFMEVLASLAIFATLALPVRLAAQEHSKPQHHHYDVIDLGTFGGANSYIGTQPVLQILNNQGAVVGAADTPVPSPNCTNPFAGTNSFGTKDCLQTYGFKWQDGKLRKLHPLRGGINSAAFYINDFGLIVGGSDNGRLDPLTGSSEQRAVLYPPWGGIIDLGTLGGTSSFGNAVNDLGQAVGGALNAIPDPSLPGATELHAFLWENGTMRDLKTLGGPDSFADFINNRGQVAGSSLTNSVVNPTTQTPTMDPFLWEKGTMKDLGSLGGVLGGVAGLNNSGQVAGNSDLEGDQAQLGFLWDQGILTPIPSLGGSFGVAISLNDAGAVVGFGAYPGDQSGAAFVWKKGAITDLGRFGNDPCSVGQSINSHGQIVGASTNCADVERAVVWENGAPIADLNALIPPNSGLYLHEADFINDRGEITGSAILPNGDKHVFLLIPCDENHPGMEGCDYDLVDASDLPPTQADHASASRAPAARLSPAEMIAQFRSSMTKPYRRFGALPSK